jgi:hypothetical protein
MASLLKRWDLTINIKIAQTKERCLASDGSDFGCIDNVKNWGDTSRKQPLNLPGHPHPASALLAGVSVPSLANHNLNTTGLDFRETEILPGLGWPQVPHIRVNGNWRWYQRTSCRLSSSVSVREKWHTHT